MLMLIKVKNKISLCPDFNKSLPCAVVSSTKNSLNDVKKKRVDNYSFFMNIMYVGVYMFID